MLSTFRKTAVVSMTSLAVCVAAVLASAPASAFRMGGGGFHGGGFHGGGFHGGGFRGGGSGSGSDWEHSQERALMATDTAIPMATTIPMDTVPMDPHMDTAVPTPTAITAVAMGVGAA
jgi:hypothetical protein